MLTPTHHCILWNRIDSEMRTFLKYQCESPLPAGHIGGGQPWQSHTPPYPHLAGNWAWMLHKAKLHNFGSEFHPLFTHYLDKLVKFLQLGPIWDLHYFDVVSLSRPISVSRNILLEKSKKFNKLSSTPELVKPLSDFSNRLRRMVFGAANLHRVSFSKKCNPSSDN